MELRREHLELQHKHCSHVFNTAAAENIEQTIEDLQAKVIELQEELSRVELERNQYWEGYRQLVIDNNKLTQVCLAPFASLLALLSRDPGACWPSSFSAEGPFIQE